MTEYTDYELQKNQEIFDTLNKTKIQDPTHREPDFWLLSDLACLFPKFMDINQPISTELFTEHLYNIVSQRIPSFMFMLNKPEHIKTIEIKGDNKSIEANSECDLTNISTDQKISRLGCEYLFRQHHGAEFTQAYFLFPECNFFELLNKAKDVALYRSKQNAHNIINILVAIILRTTNRSKASAYYALNVTWSDLFDTKNMDEIRELYNIEHSPLDHMDPEQWPYVYYMFKDIANYLDPHSELKLEEVCEQCHESAKHARKIFERYAKKPEEYLSTTDYSIPAREIDAARKQFWSNNYIKSL